MYVLELWSEKIVLHSPFCRAFNSKLSVGREVMFASELLASHLLDGFMCVYS